MPPLDLKGIKKHENKLTEMFINYKEEGKHLSVLKQTNFHAGYTIGVGFEQIILARLGLPSLRWLIYLPEPMASAWTR